MKFIKDATKVLLMAYAISTLSMQILGSFGIGNFMLYYGTKDTSYCVKTLIKDK